MTSWGYFEFVGVFVGFLIIRFIIQRTRYTRSIKQLDGPPPCSWLAGNLPDLFRPQVAAEAELSWTKTFGSSMRIKGAFGMDVLFIADPKAMQYVLNTGGYHFPKPNQSIAIATLIAGKGILQAEGASHSRQRKIMNPAFSHSALCAFLPLFRRTTQKTVNKWKDIITQGGGTSAVIDVHPWLSRTALDAIGAAGFDYEFGALDDLQSPLANVYKSLGADLFFDRSDATLAFESLWGYIPRKLITLITHIPTKRLKRLKRYRKGAGDVARSIMDTQIKTHAAGKEGGRDIMSILVKANISANPQTKLSEDEIMSQLTTLMLAGHVTTASTLNWALYELSRHPEYQHKVREEIKATRALVAQRGDEELSIADLDSMKYLLALAKETLRYHPIIALMFRDAGRNDVIPLSTPQKTRSGETIREIPISKGQRLMLSIAAYNRLEAVWGADADIWRPERFLKEAEHPKTGLGVTSNIATFSSGLQSCIGWRFALIEMQAMIIEFIDAFELSPAPGNIEIVRGLAGPMMPMIKGSLGRPTLPLTVTPIM